MKCIIDTNVPVKASCDPATCSLEELDMVNACIDFIHALIKDPDSKIVLDMDREILGEYEHNVENKGMGNQFFSWLYTYVNQMDIVADMIKLEKENESYVAFPDDKELEEFDLADRKFVALARSHNEHPPIIEAADGKWLQFVEALKKYNIEIKFLDMDYAQKMYVKKIANKRSKNV